MLFAVREFQTTDVDQIMVLVYETVHAVNAQDYTVDQLDAWAPKLSADDREKRFQCLRESLSHNISYVASTAISLLALRTAPRMDISITCMCTKIFKDKVLLRAYCTGWNKRCLARG